MKQIIFTLITIALLAISESANCGVIILGNCPGFDQAQNCMQLQGNGTAAIKIIVDPYQLNLQNTDWYVKVGAANGAWYEYHSFLHEGGGVFSTWCYLPIHPNYNYYNFILHLYDENGYRRATWQPNNYVDGGRGFNICKGNNRLSGDFNLNLENAKNNMNENLNFQSYSNVNTFDRYAIHPNPIVKDFTIEYEAIQNEEISFQIFDIEGRSIYTKQFKRQDAGLYSEHFNDLNLTKGIYFCRIQSTKSQKTIKVTKL